MQKARLTADTQSRLASIDNETYSDSDAIDEILTGDLDKRLKSQARIGKEQARFAGSSGYRTGFRASSTI